MRKEKKDRKHAVARPQTRLQTSVAKGAPEGIFSPHAVTRREALSGLVAGAATVALGAAGCNGSSKSRAAPPPARPRAPQPRAATGPFSLPELPYAPHALEPFVSRKTISFHHGKHHLGYVEKTNRFIQNTPYAGKTLEAIVRRSAGKTADSAVFNNAAQTYNHTFYWHSLIPGGGGEPPKALLARINADFGGFSKFKDTFIKTATGQFGSGWAWLVYEGGKLKVESTSNAHTPIARGAVPLLTIDVWEHAYYLDYQNKRKAYVESLLNHLAHWERANKLFLAAQS
jgi:Fe-Mn family superoxide dismutase